MDIEQPNKNPIFVIPEQQKNKLVNVAVAGGLVLAAAWWAKRAYDQYQKDQLEKKIAESPAGQQAIKLRNAMDGAGTSEKGIFEVAREITDWEGVVNAYKILTQRNLTDDLSEDLSSEELQKFFNIINLTAKKPGDKIKTAVKFSKGHIVISKALVNIRKTPRAIGSKKKDKLLVFGRSNIITSVDKGIALGFTTGRTSFDENAEPTGVLFIEITVLKKDAAVKDGFTAWVAASQIETVTPQEYKSKPTKVLTITQEQYDQASATLNGLGANFSAEIITRQPTCILNDKLKSIRRVASEIVLGFPVMELTIKPGQTYIKFQTIDNTIRWVDKAHVRTLNR